MTRFILTVQSWWTWPKWLVHIDRVIFWHMSLLNIFSSKNLVEKTMNCSSVRSSCIHLHIPAFCWFLFANKSSSYLSFTILFPLQICSYIFHMFHFSLFYSHFLYTKNSIFHKIVLLNEIGETPIKLHFTKFLNFLSFHNQFNYLTPKKWKYKYLQNKGWKKLKTWFILLYSFQHTMKL
jgi:hypothetical protein